MKMTEEQRRRVEDNFNLVYHVLNRYPGARKNWDDYVQAASEGLCKAAMYFKPEYGHAFSTYAVPMIHGTINRHYRDYDCRLVKIPRQMIDDKQFPEIIWLDGPMPGQRDASKMMSWYDAIGSPDDEILEEDRSIIKLMSKQIEDRLVGDAKTIYNLRFKNEYTQIQTAQEMNVSQAKVSRIEKQIRAKIKAAFAV